MSNLQKEYLQKYNMTREVSDSNEQNALSYRDRAKEQRLKYGESDTPPPPPNRSRAFQERTQTQHQKYVTTATTITSYGNANWRQADARPSKAGLGTKSGSFVPGDDYKSYIKRMMKSRSSHKIMTNVQSKFSPIFCSCREFLHPWTESCTVSTADILIKTVPQSIRIYSIVYALSLLMRHRIPTLLDLKRTLLGIIQSTAFLSTNSYTFVLYVCLIRNIIGRFYFLTNTFVPAYLASLTAIYIERPVRRPLLALYVANVATETMWRMAESRGFVRSIANGQAVIFGVSVSTLLFLYRLGLHKTEPCKDSIFDVLRIFVGKTEESMEKVDKNVDSSAAVPQESIDNTIFSRSFQAYLMCIRWLKRKHDCCPHKEGCLQYAVIGGLKPFVGGVALQAILKTVLNIKKLLSGRMSFQKTVFDSKTLGLGIFLGSFSFLYKGVSCALRNIIGTDDPRYAIPAGLVGSIAFIQYPDITVALYVMWKTLQIVYNLGESKKKLPKVRGFLIFLYCFCTATLFHAAIIEPLNLRPSYYKFLHSLSGGRVGLFNRTFLDVWGVQASDALREVMRRTGTEKLPTNLLGYPNRC